jgi:hypothetical protein
MDYKIRGALLNAIGAVMMAQDVSAETVINSKQANIRAIMLKTSNMKIQDIDTALDEADLSILIDDE